MKNKKSKKYGKHKRGRQTAAIIFWKSAPIQSQHRLCQDLYPLMSPACALTYSCLPELTIPTKILLGKQQHRPHRMIVSRWNHKIPPAAAAAADLFIYLSKGLRSRAARRRAIRLRSTLRTNFISPSFRFPSPRGGLVRCGFLLHRPDAVHLSLTHSLQSLQHTGLLFFSPSILAYYTVFILINASISSAFFLSREIAS